MDDLSTAVEFDWYAATVSESGPVLVEQLAGRMRGQVRKARGMHGYPLGADIVRAGRVVCKVIYGGEVPPHCWSSGEDAHDLAGILRHEYPNTHAVTRVDVAIDFYDEPAVWARLYREAVRVADFLPSGDRRARPLKLHTVGDWVREAEGFPDGRTLYIGSFKSPVLVRLYEKGKQLRKAFPDQVEKFPLDWCRLEVQIRPEKAGRHTVARTALEDLWGASRWSSELYRAVLPDGPSPFAVQVAKPQDDDRAYYYLIRQYGPLLRRLAAAYPIPEGGDSRDQYRQLADRLAADL